MQKIGTHLTKHQKYHSNKHFQLQQKMQENFWNIWFMLQKEKKISKKFNLSTRPAHAVVGYIFIISYKFEMGGDDKWQDESTKNHRH